MHRSSIQVKTVQNKYSISQKWVHSSHLVYLFKGQYCRNETWIYFRVVNVQLVIYCPLKITQHTAIIVKKDGNKTEYMLSDNSCSSFNHSKPHVLFIIVCLTGPYKCVHLVLEQFKFGSLSTILSYWPLDVQHAPHGKDLSEDLIIRVVALHKDGVGYKKFGDSLELSYSTVAKVIKRFSKTGFTRNRPRKGRSKKLSPCAVSQVQKLASKNRGMSAACIALKVAEVEDQLVSAQTIHHALQQVGLHRPRRKPLLKLAHKKACKLFSEDNLAKSMNYWNHVLRSDESKVNLFACVAMPWWGVSRKSGLAYSTAAPYTQSTQLA